jgi:hypothetical protein
MNILMHPLSAIQPQFRETIQSRQFFPRSQSKQVRITASPSNFLDTPQKTLIEEDDFEFDDETKRDVDIGELGGRFEQPNTASETMADFYSPFIGLSEEDLERDRQEALQRLEQMNRETKSKGTRKISNKKKQQAKM